jgi:hypothetical protein
LQQSAVDSLYNESDSDTVEDLPTELKSPLPNPHEPSPVPPVIISDHCSSASTLTKTEISITSKEELAWAGYENDKIPDKIQRKFVRNFHHRIFTLYRRLFGIVFIINMSIFIWVCARGLDAQRVGRLVIVNLFSAILMRQEYVINAFFNTCCSVPTSFVFTSLSLRSILI